MVKDKNRRVSFASGDAIPDDLEHARAVYQHPDPLLRRLRLEDVAGVPINDLKTAFKGKKLLAFYFGGAYGEASLRDFHRDLTQLALREYKELAIIYVSTDVDQKLMKGILIHKPWYRMTFHDGSDFAPMAKSAPAAVTELLRGEDFVTGAEVESGDYNMPTEGYEDPLEYEYVRPLSRAGLTAHLGALRTPTITIYHLPSHRVLSRYTDKDDFRKGAIERKMELWKEGRTTGITFGDIRNKMKWTIFMALIAIFYHLAVAYLGPEYNVVPELFNRFFSGEFFSKPLPGTNVAAADVAASVSSAAASVSGTAVRSIARASKSLPTASVENATV